MTGPTRGPQLDVAWLSRLLLLTELDDGDRLQDRSSQPLCPALSRPPHDVARAVALGVAVGADGTREDDD